MQGFTTQTPTTPARYTLPRGRLTVTPPPPAAEEPHPAARELGRVTLQHPHGIRPPPRCGGGGMWDGAGMRISFLLLRDASIAACWRPATNRFPGPKSLSIGVGERGGGPRAGLQLGSLMAASQLLFPGPSSTPPPFTPSSPLAKGLFKLEGCGNPLFGRMFFCLCGLGIGGCLGF